MRLPAFFQGSFRSDNYKSSRSEMLSLAAFVDEIADAELRCRLDLKFILMNEIKTLIMVRKNTPSL